jgi:hypothetical protein
MPNKQTIGELVYEIKADVSGFGAKLKESENAVQSLGNKVKAMADNQTASMFKGVAAWDLLKNAALKTFDVLKEGVDEARQDLAKLNQTRAILEAQGKAWKDVGDEVTAFGKKMLQFGIDDETAELQVARFSQRLGGDLKKSFETAKLAADLSASGFGTFAEVSEDLERILSGKGAKALVKYGVALKANATIGEQLQSVTKRVTISAEDMANSTEGQFAKMTQAQEELKSAMGKGVLIAFSDLIKKVGGATGEFMANEEMMKTVTKTVYQLTNALLATAAAAVASVQGLTAIPKAFNLGKGKLDVFSAQAARAIAEAAGNWDKVAQMDKKIADLNKQNAGNVQSLDNIAKSTTDTFKFMSDSLSQAAGNGFDDLNKKLEESDLKLAKGKLGAKELTQAQVDAAEAADKHAKSLEDMQKSVIDAKDKITELASSIKDKLTESFKDFKDNLKDTITESRQGLAELVVKSETDLKDLRSQLAEEQAKEADKQSADRIKSLQQEISQKQAVLTASAGYETRLAQQIADRQKTIDDLSAKQTKETDPIKKATLETEIEARKTALEQITNLGGLDKQITEERRTAALDEFSRMEEETFKRIDLATTAFVSEVTKLREKLEISKSVESDITKFYSDNLNLRQAALDTFALSQIATLQKLGSEANSAISSLNALQSVQSRANAGTGTGRAMGGYSQFGDFLHDGEWVMPAWMVNSFSGLVSQLESVRNGQNVSNRTINAPININANVDSTLDFRAVGREMAWELGRL